MLVRAQWLRFRCFRDLNFPRGVGNGILRGKNEQDKSICDTIGPSQIMPVQLHGAMLVLNQVGITSRFWTMEFLRVINDSMSLR